MDLLGFKLFTYELERFLPIGSERSNFFISVFARKMLYLQIKTQPLVYGFPHRSNPSKKVSGND